MLEFSVPDHLPDWIKDHTREYLESGGTKGHLWAPPGSDMDPVNALLLVTKGRKSGKAGTLPLIYGEADGKYVIIASKGGAPDHPAWYLNLAANPTVALMVGPEQFTATARTATGDEREALWNMMAEGFPQYNAYAEKAGREIPVVVLERA
jgi:deazaflavin-dependent oxidoreductase (nitroreductase family)